MGDSLPMEEYRQLYRDYDKERDDQRARSIISGIKNSILIDSKNGRRFTWFDLSVNERSEVIDKVNSALMESGLTVNQKIIDSHQPNLRLFISGWAM